jgi:hypothetical protein
VPDRAALRDQMLKAGWILADVQEHFGLAESVKLQDLTPEQKAELDDVLKKKAAKQ